MERCCCQKWLEGGGDIRGGGGLLCYYMTARWLVVGGSSGDLVCKVPFPPLYTPSSSSFYSEANLRVVDVDRSLDLMRQSRG